MSIVNYLTCVLIVSSSVFIVYQSSWAAGKPYVTGKILVWTLLAAAVTLTVLKIVNG